METPKIIASKELRAARGLAPEAEPVAVATDAERELGDARAVLSKFHCRTGNIAEQITAIIAGNIKATKERDAARQRIGKLELLGEDQRGRIEELESAFRTGPVTGMSLDDLLTALQSNNGDLTEERDALKSELQSLKNTHAQTEIFRFAAVDDLAKERSELASLRTGSVQLADDLDACKRERDHERNLREDSCKDWAGDDEAIRMICSRAGIDTEGSSYGVPPMVGWVELLHKKHDELQQQLTEQSALCERVVERFKLIAEGREHFHATYNGGHHMPDANAAFHHGMDTVFNWLSVEYVKLLQRAEGKP